MFSHVNPSALEDECIMRSTRGQRRVWLTGKGKQKTEEHIRRVESPPLLLATNNRFNAFDYIPYLFISIPLSLFELLFGGNACHYYCLLP